VERLLLRDGVRGRDSVHAPDQVGELVEVRAQVAYTGRTSRKALENEVKGRNL
jgi:acyl-CoA hydrolase